MEYKLYSILKLDWPELREAEREAIERLWGELTPPEIQTLALDRALNSKASVALDRLGLNPKYVQKGSCVAIGYVTDGEIGLAVFRSTSPLLPDWVTKVIGYL